MISNSYLLGLYGVSADTSSLIGASTTPAKAKKTQPTAPWATSAAATAPKPSELVRAALAGRRMIDENAVDLDLAGASPDYRKLFALYQGLTTLGALADRADDKGLTKLEADQVSRRFAAGLEEVSKYLQTAKFEDLKVVQGVSKTSVKTGYAQEKAPTSFVAKPIHDGDLAAPVAAFAGDVRFAMSVQSATGDVSVSMDLSEMGTTPRTLDNVLSYMNGKLEAAGVASRMGRDMIKAEPKTIKSGNKTITLPAGPDQWALKVWGASGETVSYQSVDTSDAVYVTQNVGATTSASQLLKFQADGGAAPTPQQGVADPFWVEGRVGRAELPEGVQAVRDSVVAADGSVWLLADLDEGEANQPIKGQRDVALMKYDSAGNLVQTKLLGAATSANGFSLAIADDGRIAVAGSVTGALEPGKSGADAAVADSFVTVFDSSGQELWTQRRGAKAADEATQVGFGADGLVYVAGRSKSAMPGAMALGGWDSYVQTFSQTDPDRKGVVTAINMSTQQFGTAGDDSIQAMTVSGANLFTAGVENGRAVVRRFSLDAAGVPTLADTRDLGSASGKIAGIAVENGKVVLTGETSNPALDLGAPTQAHAGGTDVFVAAFSTDLQDRSGDRLTYFGGAGDDTAADVEVRSGKVWITGSNRDEGAGKTDPTRAYLARLDLATGAVESNTTWRADGDQAKPASLTVVAGGASVLDRLGLPQGEVMQADSKLLTVATSARVGDQFTITPASGGRALTVTIEAKDTLETLAKKISVASGRQLEAKIVSDLKSTPPTQRLQIAPAANREGAIITAGPAGKDALAALGLTPGFISKTATTDKKTIGLNLPNNLNLNDAAGIKAATDALAAALTAVRSGYKALAPSTGVTTNTQSKNGSSTAYQQLQLANYQAALSRLGG